MKMQMLALVAEFKKNRHSKIIWLTFVAFSLAPLMGGLFMLIMQNPDAIAKSSMLKAKSDMLAFSANWSSYLNLLAQSVGVGGGLVFGFAASWIFGREYSDGTAKDLLALPASRVSILNAKFIYYVLWCVALAIAILALGLVIGAALQLPGWEINVVTENAQLYFFTVILTIPLGAPIAFFALYGKGYLAPVGFVVLTLVLSQIVAATGYGYYFPWAIPGLFSGAGGEYKSQLNEWSYLILILTGIAGYLATALWWKYADHTK